ncbi:polygalacturonase ADPG1-like [Prunus avium]|uniref:Polygalacturonase ADPG1-like n=1 Tax=Prunus avium TaxID=42229 RepID=A0A6P5U1P3_PRUAV|nr:polygalacturonase ADPG1-like [Prunus avium]
MEVPLTATVLVLTLWLIALHNSSCSARRVVPNDFDLFDYGAVHHNTQTYDEGFSQEVFPEGWETGATTRDSFNSVNAQTEEYDPQAFLEAWEAKTNTFNVVDYGAVGNGQVDDTKAFLKAWGAMCASSTQGTLTLLVPKGKRFLLNAVAFEGPCRASKVNFQIQGSIVAPNNIGSWTNKEMWIHFSNVQGLSVNGGGRIDGNGAVWWKACGSKGCQRPTGGSGYARKITFEGITFEDTKNPIIIDQHYFAKPTSAMDISKSVQVSDVTYRNINGTCTDEKAITLACAGGGCTNIVIDNVSIKSDLPNKRSYAYCDNAHGTSSFSMPSVPCLSH